MASSLLSQVPSSSTGAATRPSAAACPPALQAPAAGPAPPRAACVPASDTHAGQRGCRAIGRGRGRQMFHEIVKGSRRNKCINLCITHKRPPQ
eukprot:1158574-Pelagomonas_calceolata.AAC.6